jgi:hypothetical protein
VFDGLLLLQSFDALPRHFQTGMKATIRLVDQLDNLYESEIEFKVERYVQRTDRPQHGTGLFAPKGVPDGRHERPVFIDPTISVGRDIARKFIDVPQSAESE